jgi:hypothetical protein
MVLLGLPAHQVCYLQYGTRWVCKLVRRNSAHDRSTVGGKQVLLRKGESCAHDGETVHVDRLGWTPLSHVCPGWGGPEP